MNQEKHALMSKTVIASLIGAICTILSIAGIADIAPEEQASIINGILAMTTLISSLAAIYGRIKAKHKLTLN